MVAIHGINIVGSKGMEVLISHKKPCEETFEHVKLEWERSKGLKVKPFVLEDEISKEKLMEEISVFMKTRSRATDLYILQSQGG